MKCCGLFIEVPFIAHSTVNIDKFRYKYLDCVLYLCISPYRVLIEFIELSYIDFNVYGHYTIQ